ncbi:MAG TPA: DUF502 domain-containing protein [Candidatus Binatia bacterium]|nr:DUF502 domain-containing protein [Candidatus Binatia bacterium]
MNGQLGATLRRWFIAGLLVWIPLGATLLVIGFLVGLLDTSLLLIPAPMRPHIPGLGVLLSLALVLGTGAIAANLLGGRFLKWLEGLFQHIPLIRSVYGGMKKLAETLFSDNGTSFRQVLLIQYPRAGCWTLAFQTGTPPPQVQRAAGGGELVTVFVPTTPNPTSGFVLFLPRAETVPLSLSVEEGMRLVISLGVLGPDAPATGSGPSTQTLPAATIHG